jgi:hypothetical protein
MSQMSGMHEMCEMETRCSSCVPDNLDVRDVPDNLDVWTRAAAARAASTRDQTGGRAHSRTAATAAAARSECSAARAARRPDSTDALQML